MADDKTASPTLEEGTQEVKTTEQPPSEMEDLLSELQRVGIEDKNSLHNVVNASQQAGKAWNEVGELRRALDQANSMISQLQNTPSQQHNYDEYGNTPSIDLKKEIRSTLRDFYMEDIIKPQQEMQQRVWREAQEIQTDPDFPIIKELWETHSRSPEFNMRLQSGQTTMKDEYNRVARTYLRELAKKSYDQLSSLNSKSREEVPHVEQGTTQSIPNIPADDEKKEKLGKIVKGRESGDLSSDQALDDLIKTFLPADDPIYRHER